MLFSFTAMVCNIDLTSRGSGTVGRAVRIPQLPQQKASSDRCFFRYTSAGRDAACLRRPFHSTFIAFPMTNLEMFLVKSQWLLVQQNNHIIRQNLNIASAVNSVMTTLSHIATGDGISTIHGIEQHVHQTETNTKADMESWASLSGEILKLAGLMDLIEKQNRN